MIVYLSLLVAFIGLITFSMSSQSKASEVGRILFWTGMLAFLLQGDKIVTALLRR